MAKPATERNPPLRDPGWERMLLGRKKGKRRESAQEAPASASAVKTRRCISVKRHAAELEDTRSRGFKGRFESFSLNVRPSLRRKRRRTKATTLLRNFHKEKRWKTKKRRKKGVLLRNQSQRADSARSVFDGGSASISATGASSGFMIRPPKKRRPRFRHRLREAATATAKFCQNGKKVAHNLIGRFTPSCAQPVQFPNPRLKQQTQLARASRNKNVPKPKKAIAQSVARADRIQRRKAKQRNPKKRRVKNAAKPRRRFQPQPPCCGSLKMRHPNASKVALRAFR